MKGFYVELSSNASYATNTVANFKNRIQLLYPLRNDWEVGMVEISFTKSWKNLRQDFIVGLEKLFDKEKQNTPEKFGIVRSGYYESAQNLCDEIISQLGVFKDEVDSLPKFKFDNITKEINIEPGKDKLGNLIVPYLDKEIAEILGYDGYKKYTKISNSSNDLLPNRPADMNAELRTLYVYTDIIEPQYVGDSRTKLLRTVGVPSDVKYGHQIVKHYEHPHYVPLLTTEFENVEIDIKDDINERVPFMFGRTRVKLHFRQCQTHI